MPVNLRQNITCVYCDKVKKPANSQEDCHYCLDCEPIAEEHSRNEGYTYQNSNGHLCHTWDFEESIGE